MFRAWRKYNESLRELNRLDDRKLADAFETLARRTLVGIEDLWLAVTSQGILQRLDAECRFHRDRDAPRQHATAEPIEHDSQIDEAARHISFPEPWPRMSRSGRVSVAKGFLQMIAALLHRVGLSGYQERDVSNLSGGEAQRVSLARTLANAQRRSSWMSQPRRSMKIQREESKLSCWTSFVSGG